MRTRQLRALRGAAAATIAVLLAAVSHTIGGGAPPSLAILLGVSAIAWPVTTALVGRKLRSAGLAAAVVVAQVALHTVFALTSSVGAMSAGLAGTTPHQHGPVILDTAGTVAQIVQPSATMLGWHALAAVVSFVLLFAGERMLRAIAAWTLLLLRRATTASPGSTSIRLTTSADAPAPRTRITRGVVHRRGPPLSWSDASVA